MMRHTSQRLNNTDDGHMWNHQAENAIDSSLLVEALSTRSHDTKCYSRAIQPRRCTLEVGCRSHRACCEWVIVSKKKTTHSAAAAMPTSASQGNLGDGGMGSVFRQATDQTRRESRLSGLDHQRSPSRITYFHMRTLPGQIKSLSNSLEESLGLSSTKPQINGCNRGTRKLKVVAPGFLRVAYDVQPCYRTTHRRNHPSPLVPRFSRFQSRREICFTPSRQSPERVWCLFHLMAAPDRDHHDAMRHVKPKVAKVLNRCGNTSTTYQSPTRIPVGYPSHLYACEIFGSYITTKCLHQRYRTRSSIIEQDIIHR
ncbi:uncharacterized protein B0T23DRAFT_149620 [Neurospora hispaniola]|uniref:Uncharacterized protein n=1 Tax=Neurospora hispaniola TaxID=588809 RepID=A0AAJ0I889_9PEZI|nr:hypothetical protein B0T23DRAFT_149620 [Neurospora hispaniola]